LATGYWYECARLYTVKHGGYKQVLSIRVQTPTLAMVVDRFKEMKISNHNYWELQTLYRETF
jgi:DNA topoisomerase-3